MKGLDYKETVMSRRGGGGGVKQESLVPNKLKTFTRRRSDGGLTLKTLAS